MIASLYATTTEPWPLRPGDVHVWRFANRQDPGRLAGRLPEDEQLIGRRFIAAAHRDRYIVQRAIIRSLLARYVDADPWQLRFARGPHGKPRLVGVAIGDLELNLSHADDLGLLAVARGIGVGVDLERLDTNLDVRAIGRVVLARDEVAIGWDRRGLLRIWCRKEACLKATGLGLVDDLTAISVVADRAEIHGSVVYLQDLAISPSHIAALATTVTCAQVAAVELETYQITT